MHINGLSRRLRVFLCHSSGDKPAVRELYRRLQFDGFDPWLDEENLDAGQEWEKEIHKAVRESDVVIVCLSRESINKRGYVQKEIKSALDVADEQPEGSVFLIPLRLELCDVPERLSRWQWVNLFEERGYARLGRVLRSCSNKIGIIEPSLAGEAVDFRGVNQVVSVLLADISGLTTLSEKASYQQEVAELLRKFHSATFGLISEHGGTLNWNFGGGLMAVFGVPAPEPKDAFNAIGAAVAIQQQVAGMKEETIWGAVEIGIVINTGIATVGHLTSEQHSNFTVTGNAVNLAARLNECLARSIFGQIVVSEETAKSAGEIGWTLRSMGSVTVKNRVEPVPIFEVDWRHPLPAI